MSVVSVCGVAELAPTRGRGVWPGSGTGSGTGRKEGGAAYSLQSLARRGGVPPFVSMDQSSFCWATLLAPQSGFHLSPPGLPRRPLSVPRPVLLSLSIRQLPSLPARHSRPARIWQIIFGSPRPPPRQFYRRMSRAAQWNSYIRFVRRHSGFLQLYCPTAASLLFPLT